MEAKKEEHFNAMVHEARTTTRKAPHDVHVAGKVQRQRVQPKKRDRRTIEEVQAVRDRGRDAVRVAVSVCLFVCSGPAAVLCCSPPCPFLVSGHAR